MRRGCLAPNKTSSNILNIIYILIPLALVIVIAMIMAFLWSVRSGQFDDMEGPAWRILQDDDDIKTSGSSNKPDHTSQQSK